MKYHNLNPIRNALTLSRSVSNGVKIIGLVCLMVLLVQSLRFKVESVYSVRYEISNGACPVKYTFLFHGARVVREGIDINWAVENILSNRKEVNYEEIIPDAARLVFFGESHLAYAPKRELVKNIALFKEMEFTHLAMEVFRDNGIHQQVLDEYFEASEAEVAEGDYLDKIFKFIDDFFPPYLLSREDPVFFVNLIYEYLDVIKQAKKHGMRIIAINTRQRGESDDEHMADKIMKILEDEENKVLVLVGAAHLDMNVPEENLLKITREEYKDSIFIDVLEKEDSERTTSFSTSIGRLENLIYRAIVQAGLDSQRFMVNAVSLKSLEWVVYRPRDFPE